VDLHKLSGDSVIDGEREFFFGNAAMVAEHATMDPSRCAQRFNVCEKAIAKVSAETAFLLLIEVKAGD